MIFFLTIASAFDKIVALVGKLAAWLMYPMMAVILFDVIMRRWFNVGSTMLQELEWHLHGAMFLLMIAWAYNKGSHVRIELVHDQLSQRKKALIELLGCLFFLLPYVTAILIFGGDYTAMSFANSEISASQTGLPYRWLIKAILVFGFVLLGLAALSRTIKAVAYLTGNEKAQKLSGFDTMPPQSGES